MEPMSEPSLLQLLFGEDKNTTSLNFQNPGAQGKDALDTNVYTLWYSLYLASIDLTLLVLLQYDLLSRGHAVTVHSHARVEDRDPLDADGYEKCAEAPTKKEKGMEP